MVRLACVLSCLLPFMVPVYAIDQMNVGALTKLVRDTGKPAKAILIGDTADYLHEKLKTKETIYADASLVKKVDDRCNRFRIRYTIPELIVTAKNPKNPSEQKQGPFEFTVEANLCDS